MTNPWLTLPLTDYEAHMALPAVGQAEMLATEFAALLHRYVPTSVALIGCAGGNGFDHAAQAGIERLVGIDINAGYLAVARARYAGVVPGLELYCADIAGDLPALPAVELVYAALVFEYVDVPAALRNITRLCQAHGLLAAVLQLPKHGAASVTPSPFTSLNDLTASMRLVPPQEFKERAQEVGFTPVSEQVITLPSGKQFSSHLLRLG